MIRFLLYVLLIYLIYRFIRNVIGSAGRHGDHASSRPEEASHIKQQERPDIDEADIEDAVFKEIDEKKP